ncbi:unnamed protein product [Rotaria magnacalcarata]
MDSKSLEEAIQNQRMQKRQFVLGSQIFGVILCYEPSFQCDYGLLCLDWCNICDHKQNCADGADEEHCEFLEFHECELNEYRCGNGACIDRSYLLDGEMDCMDGTDEKNAYDLLRSRDCPFVVDHFGCDEMVFHPMYFSCGDGQFILEEQRYIQGREETSFCISFRENNFACELPWTVLVTSTRKMTWGLRLFLSAVN